MTDYRLSSLIKQLAESRARFADSEARRVELAAVIQTVKDILYVRPDCARSDSVAEGMIWRLVSESSSTVLGEHDQEVAARALEAFADEQFGTVDPARPPWASEVMIRDRAAAIRKGLRA